MVATAPVIGAGGALTVKSAVEIPPVPEKVTVQVPAEIPVIEPVVALIVAMLGMLVLHVPVPDSESCSVVALPTHTPIVPVMAANEFCEINKPAKAMARVKIFFIIKFLNG
jgi:hypothetical protein